MKTIFLAFFLLFAFSTTLPSTTSGLVYDADGGPLINGGIYHIVPAFKGRGGGLALAKTGNETCPLTVVQARSELNLGLPARLSYPMLLPYIDMGTLLNINFTKVPHCVPKPSEWDGIEEFPIGWSMKLASVTGFMGPFQIQQYEKSGRQDYKLTYCPGSGNVCGDLGIDHKRRLVVTDGNPLVVHFKKAIN